MRITVELLEQKKACEEGIEFFEMFCTYLGCGGHYEIEEWTVGSEADI